MTPPTVETVGFPGLHFVNLGCVLFDPDMSPAKDYLDMVKDKKVTKRRLDIQLRNCKRFLLYQFDEIEKDIADASLAKSS